MTRRNVAVNTAVVLVIYLFLKGCWTLSPRIFETLELQAQDQMFRLSRSIGIKKDVSPDIVYVDLDDKSRFSLPHGLNDPKLFEEIFSVLRRAGVALQLIDIMFVVEDSGEELAGSVEAAGNVYLPVVLMSSEDPAGGVEDRVPPSVTWKNRPRGRNPFPEGRLLVPLKAYHHRCAGSGHINCWPDYDGVYRRLPLFLANGDGLVPALSLRVACDFLKISPENTRIEEGQLVLADATFPDGRKKDITLPFGENGQSRINFAGPWPHVFGHYSAAVLLERGRTVEGINELRDELEGTIAIVSNVTTGGRDFGPVPFSPYSPLSDLHAQFLNSVLMDGFIREAGRAAIAVQDLLLCCLLLFIALKLRGFQLVLVGAGVTGVLFGTVFYLTTWEHVVYPVVRPAIFLIIATITILLIQFVTMQQDKQLMKARLAPYFAPSVMEKILTSPEMLTSVSKKRLTFLFSDIVGFTGWSSDKEAQDIHETLNRYFREMTDIVFLHEGTLDKFMGDGMLVFFGDPTPQEDHVRRAVLAALAMQKKVWELRKEWSETGGLRIRIRIGIHTGDVVVGNMGSNGRMDYTVIGSQVNLTQRLESNCAPDRVLVSKDIYEQLDDSFITSYGGKISVKGFDEPVEVYYVDRYQPDGPGAV